MQGIQFSVRAWKLCCRFCRMSSQWPQTLGSTWSSLADSHTSICHRLPLTTFRGLLRTPRGRLRARHRCPQLSARLQPSEGVESFAARLCVRRARHLIEVNRYESEHAAFSKVEHQNFFSTSRCLKPSSTSCTANFALGHRLVPDAIIVANEMLAILRFLCDSKDGPGPFCSCRLPCRTHSKAFVFLHLVDGLGFGADEYLSASLCFV